MTIFSTAKDEKVVSVERISEPEGDDDGALPEEIAAETGDLGTATPDTPGEEPAQE